MSKRTSPSKGRRAKGAVTQTLAPVATPPRPPRDVWTVPDGPNYDLAIVNKSLYQGCIPVPCQSEHRFRYTGPKLPLLLWQQVLSWFSTHRQGEVMIRLYIDDQDQWRAVPFPQHYPTGITVSEIPDHPNTPQTGNWRHFGSAHHHCSARAFPSGTDDQDEIAIEGLHFIVGNVDQAEMSVFWRLCVSVPGELDERGQLKRAAQNVFVPSSRLDINDVFEFPSWVPNEPVWREVVFQKLFHQVVYRWYPPEWDKALIPPPQVQAAPYTNPYHSWTWTPASPPPPKAKTVQAFDEWYEQVYNDFLAELHEYRGLWQELLDDLQEVLTGKKAQPSATVLHKWRSYFTCQEMYDIIQSEMQA